MKRFLVAGLALLMLAGIAMVLVRTGKGGKEHPALDRPSSAEPLVQSRPSVDLTGVTSEDSLSTATSERTAVAAQENSEASLQEARRSADSPILQGTVKDDAGRGVPGCEVVLQGGRFDRHTIADAEGKFTFKSVKPQVVWLHVSNAACFDRFPTLGVDKNANPEVPGWGATRIDLKEEREQEVTLTLLRAAFIEGRVLDENGEPLEGATVRAEFQSALQDLESFPEVTDEEGLFSVRTIPGRSTVLVSAQVGPKGQDRVSGEIQDLETRPGETRRIGDLATTLTLGKLSINGSVVDPEGNRLDGVGVRLEHESGAIVDTLVSRRFGYFRFEDVEPGFYRVIIAYDQVSPKTRPVQIGRDTGSVVLGKVEVQLD